jgi:hypothetical protein
MNTAAKQHPAYIGEAQQHLLTWELPSHHTPLLQSSGRLSFTIDQSDVGSQHVAGPADQEREDTFPAGERQQSTSRYLKVPAS